MVVELANAGRHQLSKDDADIVLSLTGEDRIWQKERLLNIGIGELPRHVEYVAWVDCDVIFDDEGWVEKATARLDENGGLLQLFGVAVHLPRDVDATSLSRRICRKAAPLFTNIAIANAIRGSLFDENETRLTRAQGALNNDTYITIVDKYNSYGIAWSASRKTIEKCGLYDKNIVGGGDTVHVFAALSRLEQYFSLRPHNDKQKRHAENWAQEAKKAGLLSDINSLEQPIFHMWHGDIIDRHYRKRYEILTQPQIRSRHGHRTGGKRNLALARSRWRVGARSRRLLLGPAGGRRRLKRLVLVAALD